jgi:hypothetical protein
VKDRFAVMALALWWGSLSAIACFVVPMLFAHLPTPAMAGNLAGRLFGAQTWVSLACGGLVLLVMRSNADNPSVRWSFSAIGLVAISMLAALLIEFGVAPRILAREDLKLWHTVGSALYVLQWLCTDFCSGAPRGSRRPECGGYSRQCSATQAAGLMNRNRRLRRPASASGGLHSP